MAAVTSVTILNRTHRGNRRERIADVVSAGTTAAGGDTFQPSDFDLTTIDSIQVGGASISGAHSDHRIVWDRVNNKLKILNAAGTEVTGAVAATYRVHVVGQ